MKQLIPNYSFDKEAKQITFTDQYEISIERVLLITDVTTGTIIYQFNDATKGGSVASNVLTLDYDTNTDIFSDSDKLQIYYDTPISLDVLKVTNNPVNDNIMTLFPDVFKYYPDAQGQFCDIGITPDDNKQWVHHNNAVPGVLRGSPLIVDDGYVSNYSVAVYANGNSALRYARKTRGTRTIPPDTKTVILGGYLVYYGWWTHGLYQYYFGFDSQRNSKIDGSGISRAWPKICYEHSTDGTTDNYLWKADFGLETSSPAFTGIPNTIQGSPATNTVYPFNFNEGYKPTFMPVWFSYSFSQNKYALLSLNSGDLTVDMSGNETVTEAPLEVWQNGFNILFAVQNRSTGSTNTNGIGFDAPFLAFSNTEL